MQDIIASFLAQEKQCSLPLLGSFTINTKPAAFDVANKQMFPPTDEIIYSAKDDHPTDRLRNYAAQILNLSPNEAEEKLHNWCLKAKAILDSYGTLHFNSIGSLQKDHGGSVYLKKKNGITFFEPVIAERAIHKNDEHAVLVGDRETTSAVMNEFYRDEDIVYRKSKWKMWAIILFSAGALLLILNYFNHSFTTNGVGNQSSFPVKDPPATYFAP